MKYNSYIFVFSAKPFLV